MRLWKIHVTNCDKYQCSKTGNDTHSRPTTKLGNKPDDHQRNRNKCKKCQHGGVA